MPRSLTRVLLKIFVFGFYRMHAGLLLTLFISLFIHFFFTSVLNQTHLTQEGIILNNLKLVLTSVSNPAAMGLLFLIWLIYTVKSAKYVMAQLSMPQNQFLFYSSTSLSIRRQLMSWILIQCLISLPIIALGMFATAVGFIFHYYVIPAIIPFYLGLLIFASAYQYTRAGNQLIQNNEETYRLRLVKNWPKPLFSLFLYQILSANKRTYLVTKFGSVLILTGFYVLFYKANSDLRSAGMATLAVILSHAVLIFQSHEFETNFLKFARNFPYSRQRAFMNIACLYLILMLPEIIWIFATNDFPGAVEITLLGMSFALLFRTILYKLGLKMAVYLQYAFSLFIVSSLFLLFGLIWPVIILNLIISSLLFYRSYARYE